MLYTLFFKLKQITFNAFNQCTVNNLLDMKAYTTSHKNNHAKQFLLSQSSMKATHNTSQNLGGFFKGKVSPFVLPVLWNLQYSWPSTPSSFALVQHLREDIRKGSLVWTVTWHFKFTFPKGPSYQHSSMWQRNNGKEKDPREGRKEKEPTKELISFVSSA